MPDYWQYPTVSMGLGPIQAIYRARFMRYLQHRGLIAPTDAKVWCFVGDGETDEPETLGAITLASREALDNLIFVVNCNLQRLDGPVRGNGKIIQELEAIFRGAGWHVLKVLWGSNWDPLIERDVDGVLARRFDQCVDGEYQRFKSEDGAYVRKHFFGADPRLLAMVEQLSDDDLWKLRRGGHDVHKVYAAYKAAVDHAGAPTVILAKTIKGYGLGEAGEGKNITHQQKKLNDDELLEFRDRFEIPISDADVDDVPFYRPPADSIELQYLLERRRALGGFVPERRRGSIPFRLPEPDLFAEFREGTEGREVSTTMVFVRLLSKLLRDPEIGGHIVPIVPDEARTFGMEGLFRQVSIYSSVGQLYEPVDSDSLLSYKEAKSGQILEEGITEAGSLCSWIASATSLHAHGKATVPFYIYYSMFGYQRVGDLMWAAGDMRARGFLLGGTAGRTTLAGEGLQHQDGHSLLLMDLIPNCRAFDVAYAYELATVIEDGLKRMYDDDEEVFYYLTVENENYAHPPMPEGVREGILRGLYRLLPSGLPDAPAQAQLLGSGSILNEAVAARALLEERFGVGAAVWSVTSYQQLRAEGLGYERARLRDAAAEPPAPWVSESLGGAPGVIVAASDYVRWLPDGLARWLPKPIHSLGTDGFGRSEDRASLRDFFEVDARHIAHTALVALARDGAIPAETAAEAAESLGIDAAKPDPRYT